MSLDEEILIKYRSNAVQVVSFRLVFFEEDVDEPNESEDICIFPPEMAHQIFGNSELIFGYENLVINLFYHHNSSKCLVTVKYKSKLTTLRVDNILSLLNEWLPRNYFTNVEEYKLMVKKERNDCMFGEVLCHFKRRILLPFVREKDFTECTYKITKTDINDELFQEFHERFETFIIWYIDAANFIDLRDKLWMIYYVYEECVMPKTGKKIVTPVGFTAIYKFFSYPESCRARISQFFILPTHQRKGLGTILYQTVYKQILEEMPDVIDITVEGPSESFQRMRDYCDSLHVYNDLAVNNENLLTKSGKCLYSYFSKHKINKKQGVRVADVLHYTKFLQNGIEEKSKFEEIVYNRLKQQKMNEKQFGKMARRCFAEKKEKKELNEQELREETKLYVDLLTPVALKLMGAVKMPQKIV